MIDWILEHWDELLAIYGGLVAICTAVVKLTPTQKDDTFLAKVLTFMDAFSTAYRKK